ncbi:hypothetical protein [Chelativorans sp. J32]|uniref:hypothetical protein n=1 Tax=Chelativorans sp. J32 TaxID=935840 RepID=UPI0012EB553F|nr:hypothetical protein [Chelativorans sp. J32]
MNTPQVELTSDDVFVLGNIASLATLIGLGEDARPLWKLIQEFRPENAGGFLIEAMYFFSLGDFSAGIDVLEQTGAFYASVNRDEALAFHLYLLQQDGRLERALGLGEAYLDEGLLRAEAALQTVSIVVDECAAALGRGDNQYQTGKGAIR